MECLFCQIAEKKFPTAFVYTDEYVVAFNDIKPQAPHHVIIIPREHITAISDLKESHTKLIGHMIYCSTIIANKLNIANAGYRLIMNCNEAGGQTVYHIHLHLLGGRNMQWPPG